MVFTRYLYEKEEVKYSLLFALLVRQRDEALFWAYELYFSGLEEDLIEWIQQIYSLYRENNPRFTKRFEENIRRLREKDVSLVENRECIIGEIVLNLSYRTYDANILPINALNPETQQERGIYIRFLPRDVEPYNTVKIKGAPRKYLRTVSRFAVRKSSAIQFKELIEDPAWHLPIQTGTRAYFDDWLYHASASPYWKNILSAYRSAAVCDKTYRVEFTDESEFDDFYDKYGFEPDEQAEDIHAIHGIYL
jgi:hypothetical protein